MNHYELESRWVEGKLMVKFSFGDPARMLSGDRQGELGRIVALWKIEPEARYIIEFPDGTSASATETELELLRDAKNRPQSRLILKQIR
jgi:hypothetical protein